MLFDSIGSNSSVCNTEPTAPALHGPSIRKHSIHRSAGAVLFDNQRPRLSIPWIGAPRSCGKLFRCRDEAARRSLAKGRLPCRYALSPSLRAMLAHSPGPGAANPWRCGQGPRQYRQLQPARLEPLLALAARPLAPRTPEGASMPFSGQLRRSALPLACSALPVRRCG